MQNQEARTTSDPGLQKVRYVIFHPPVVMIYKKQENRIPVSQTNSRHVCVCVQTPETPRFTGS